MFRVLMHLEGWHDKVEEMFSEVFIAEYRQCGEHAS